LIVRGKKGFGSTGVWINFSIMCWIF
jgi:hypothetical protein